MRADCKSNTISSAENKAEKAENKAVYKSKTISLAENKAEKAENKAANSITNPAPEDKAKRIAKNMAAKIATKNKTPKPSSNKDARSKGPTINMPGGKDTPSLSTQRASVRDGVKIQGV